MSRLHALLIGIDGYEPNLVFEGKEGYAPLHGCVRDIEAVEEFLRAELDMTDEQILKLVAPGEGQPFASPELVIQTPTYEGLVGAFDLLTRRAEPGDQVYIHYSGHGGIVPTLLPEIKTDRGYDETLVPVNIGSTQARHLRDVEFSLLLERMVGRGLIVTLVLDCCHSGGALRGGNPPDPPGLRARGRPAPDLTSRPRESLVGSQEDLLANLRRKDLPPADSRGGAPRSYLRAATGDWVLLAACREDERAYELKLNGVSRGAFTVAWLKALENAARRSPCREIFEQVRAQVRGLRPDQDLRLQQTPQLLGAGDRIAFGKNHLPSRSSARVVKVEGDRLVLDTGAIHALAKRARFALYPAGTEQDDPERVRGEAEVVHLGAATSCARIVGTLNKPIEAGDRATLVDPGGLRLKSSVQVKAPPVDVPRLHRKALEEFEEVLRKRTAGFLRLAEAADAPHYQVKANERGEFEVGDPWGETLPFPTVPPIAISALDAVSLFVERLDHLARFRNVAGMPKPGGQASDLTGKLQVNWLERPVGKLPRLRDGEVLRLEVVNQSSREIFVAAVALRSDGSIQTVSLGDEQATAFRLTGRIRQAAEQTRVFRVPIRLFEGQTRVRERLRVFAMLNGDANFQLLNLPTWEGKIPEPPRWRATDSLSALFTALVWEARHRVVVESKARREWTVETLDYEIEA